ncbi:uncharacterized protein HMPREF1541_08173 [Cyphellophora europaea CBS 101466]|uniref:Uncharacterized protein n=1 Tax=Cyphellophora europaea (strain CBS 101466) TaxID=1220924 RepID=W2RNA0_CYPE1|nr:uncharacterized protein HMPREF1541_08173 [Cyphellophora europaea CBS 101466]ETN37183.1 hypothetical protein HMPREF1541_08173 [Cyphellophora europaea CBS 101466]
MPPQPHLRGNDSHISSTQIRPVRFPLSFDAQNLLQQEASKLRATVKFQYFPECARLVREHLGAAQAVPFDWRQRQRQPLSSVKPDWSHGMQPPKTCLRQALGDEEAAFWVARGWVVVCLSRGLMLGDEEVKLALEHDSKVDSAVRDSLGSSDVAGSGPCIEVRVLALLK